MSSETNFKEYIVTLHQFDDLESFYTDMETEGGNLYIPNREVDCHLRRPVSRNTHYMLTDQEAEQLRQDPRVLAVELTLEQLGIELRPAWTQTSSFWSKSNTLAQGQLNWALLRSTEGQQRSNWGSAGTPDVTGTVTVPFSGKNVDVVIMDGRLEINHPEFAKNTDGSGGSRVVQYNWFDLNPTVTGGAAGTYSYTPADVDSDWHGTFVAGIVAGNTQGWARDANIYNLYVYGVEPKVTPSLWFDYIKVWHQNKPINPATGRKNPTIMNCSFVYSTRTVLLSDVTTIVYRGTTYTGPFTEAQAKAYGLEVYASYVYIPTRSASGDADLADCIAAGIIVVGAAGNDSVRADLSTSLDYNNSVTYNFMYLGTNYPQGPFLYQRGSSPAAADNVICVGGIGDYGIFSGEEKAVYSTCGARVDLFAPGSGIRSSANNNWADAATSTVADTRNPNYKITKSQGTSFSSPQVAGVLATMLEVTPAMTPAAALSYITGNAKSGQMYNSGNLNYYDLQGAPNLYLFAKYPTTISISANTASVTPLQSVIYTITVSGVADGALVYLTESGTSTSTDFVDGFTQTSVTVNSGTATLTRTVNSNIIGTRSSTLQLRTGGYDGNIQASATVTVTDGVVPPITYVSLVGVTDYGSGSTTLYEGLYTATFTLTTTNAVNGTTVYWTTLGAVTTSDFIDGQVQGTVQIQNNKATISRSARADSVTEGAESFRLEIRETGYTSAVKITSGAISISDTSQTPVIPPTDLSGKILPVDYNNARTSVVSVLGVTTGGTVNAVQGYGQAVASSAVSQHEKVTEIQLDNLRLDIIKAHTHQNGTAPTITDVSQSTKVQSSIFSVYQTLATGISTNKNVVASNQLYTSTVITRSESYQAYDGTDGSGKGWKDYANHTMIVTFSSGNDARYFFNAGSTLTFSATHSGGTTDPAVGNSQNLSWTNLLNAVTAEAFTFGRTQFYQLTDTYTPIYTKYSTDAGFTANYYRISAKYASTLDYGATNNTYGGATQIMFLVEFVDAYRQGDTVYYDGVDGTFTSSLTETRVKGSGMGGAVTVPMPSSYTTSPASGFNESTTLPIYKTAAYTVTATPNSVTEDSRQIELKFIASNYNTGNTITWTVAAPNNTNPVWNLFDFDQTGWTASVNGVSGKKELTKTSTNSTGNFLASSSTVYITTNPDHFTEGTESFTVTARGAADGSGGGFDSTPVTITVTDSSLTYTPGLVIQHPSVTSPNTELNAVPGESYGPVQTYTIKNTSLTRWVGSLEWLRVYGMYVDISGASNVNGYRLTFPSGWGLATSTYNGSSMYVFPEGEVIFAEGDTLTVNLEIYSTGGPSGTGNVVLKVLSNTGTAAGSGPATGPGYNIKSDNLSYAIAPATIALTVTALSSLSITYLTGQTGTVTESIRIRNTGNAKATISAFAAESGNGSLITTYNNTALGQQIAPGGYFDASVTYTSGNAGSYLVAILVQATNPYATTASPPNTYQSISVTLAIPTISNLAISGTTSGKVTNNNTAYITFNNTGNASLVVSNVSIGGTFITSSLGFALPITIPAGNSASLPFTWSRSRIGASVTPITITSNNNGSAGSQSNLSPTLSGTVLTPTITVSSSNGIVSGARTNSTDWSTTFALKKLSYIFIQINGAEPTKSVILFPTWESGQPHSFLVESGLFNDASKPISVNLLVTPVICTKNIDSSGTATLWQGTDQYETQAWLTGIGQHYYAIPVGIYDNGTQAWHQVPGRMGDGVNVNVNQIKFSIEIYPKPQWNVNGTIQWESDFGTTKTVTITTGDDWAYTISGCTSLTTASTSDKTALAGQNVQEGTMIDALVFDVFDTNVNGMNGPNIYHSTPGVESQGGRQALAAGKYYRYVVTRYKGVAYQTGTILINVLSPAVYKLSNYQNNPYQDGEGNTIFTYPAQLENQFVSFDANGYNGQPSYGGVAVLGMWIIQRRTLASAANTAYGNCNIIAACDDKLEVWVSGPSSPRTVLVGTANLNSPLIVTGLTITSDASSYVHWKFYFTNITGPAYWAVALTIGADINTALFYRGTGTSDMLASSES